MRPWYRFWQCMSQVVFCAFFGLRVSGRHNVPATGPVLLVSNHQSFLDPPLCGVPLNRELDYIARKSLFNNRLFGRYISSLNAVPIHRAQEDDPAIRNLEAIRTIVGRLKNGRAMTFFPEGTRTADGPIRRVKGGMDLIVRRSGATLVPVVIDGAFEAWPRHQLFPAMGSIWICYGQPIAPEQVRKMSREELTDQINARLRTMQNELRIKLGRRPYDYSDAEMNGD